MIPIIGLSGRKDKGIIKLTERMEMVLEERSGTQVWLWLCKI